MIMYFYLLLSFGKYFFNYLMFLLPQRFDISLPNIRPFRNDTRASNQLRCENEFNTTSATRS